MSEYCDLEGSLSVKHHRLIFSEHFTRKGICVTYLDVGARGDIAQPWSEFETTQLKVIGFEPDPEEAKRLSARFPNRRYFPFALWNSEETRTLYLNEWTSTSSLLRPNDSLLRQFAERHWEGRVPVGEVAVRCTTIDAIIESEGEPDFIKLDTQGGELEILRGASHLLSRAAPMILAETWCDEVYDGVRLVHEIMAFLHRFGYRVFDLNRAANWRYRQAGSQRSKRRLMGLDLLFVKDLRFLGGLAPDRLIKLAGLAELYGFRDFALALVDQYGQQIGQTEAVALAHILKKNERGENALLARLARKAGRLLGLEMHQYPTLH